MWSIHTKRTKNNFEIGFQVSWTITAPSILIMPKKTTKLNRPVDCWLYSLGRCKNWNFLKHRVISKKHSQLFLRTQNSIFWSISIQSKQSSFPRPCQTQCTPKCILWITFFPQHPKEDSTHNAHSQYRKRKWNYAILLFICSLLLALQMVHNSLWRCCWLDVSLSNCKVKEHCTIAYHAVLPMSTVVFCSKMSGVLWCTQLMWESPQKVKHKSDIRILNPCISFHGKQLPALHGIGILLRPQIENRGGFVYILDWLWLALFCCNVIVVSLLCRANHFNLI